MYFCEKCNLLMHDNVCENCGKKKLREVQDNDFCFYVTLPADQARCFEENLKLQNIPVALLGFGLDLRTRASSNFNVFIPYCYFEKVTEVYNTIFGRGQQGLDNEELKDMQFTLISPKKYAEGLKEMFYSNPSLWYKRISPESVADELMETVEEDYSEIWHEYCAVCFKPIDKDSTEDFYLSEDEFTWVCKECYEKLKK